MQSVFIRRYSKIFKRAKIFGVFTLLFVVLGLLVIVFLKTQVYQSVEDHYEPTISLNEVDNLSNTEIVEKLFTIYLEHYKDKPIFNDQRIKDYKFIGTSERYAVADGIAFSVTYSIQQHLWNDYWEIGNGQVKDGMVEKFRYVSLVKEKDQFRLKLMGIEPPIPK